MKLHQWISWELRRFLVFLSDCASRLAHVLYNYRILAIGLAILYLVLWIADQGQDLLLNLNTEWYGPISFLVTLVALALLNWHLPKYFTDQAKKPADRKAGIAPHIRAAGGGHGRKASK